MESFRENEGPGENSPKQRLHLFCRGIRRVRKGKDSPQKPRNASYSAEKSCLKVPLANSRNGFRGILSGAVLWLPATLCLDSACSWKYCGFRLYARGTMWVDLPTEQVFLESDYEFIV